MSSGEHHSHRRMSLGQCIVNAITMPFVLVLAFLYFGLWFIDIYQVPWRGRVLVACNHPSYLDPGLLWLAVAVRRLFRFARSLAKIELFEHSLAAQFLTTFGAVAINRSEGRVALEFMRTELEADEAVIIFPEASRSRVGGVLDKLHKGVILLAIQTKSPIVPAAIVGTDRALPRGRLLPTPHRVTILLGTPYGVVWDGKLDENGRIPEPFLNEECERLMWYIVALLPERMHPALDDVISWYGETCCDPQNQRSRQLAIYRETHREVKALARKVANRPSIL